MGGDHIRIAKLAFHAKESPIRTRDEVFNLVSSYSRSPTKGYSPAIRTPPNPGLPQWPLNQASMTMSPARSLSSALQGGFHLRILQSTCCNKQCPASHQCCTPRLLCLNNDHLHVSSEYEEPRHFFIRRPSPASKPSI